MAVSSRVSDPEAPVLVDAAPGVAFNAAYNERVARENERAVQDAYNKGRRDERASRKRHPFIMAALFILAAVGGVVVSVAVINGGSFSRGGQVVDQNLAVAADRAEPVVRQAGAQAQQSINEAGQSISNRVQGAPAPNQPTSAPPARNP